MLCRLLISAGCPRLQTGTCVPVSLLASVGERGLDAELLKPLGVEVEHAVVVGVCQRDDGRVVKAKLVVERTDQGVASVVGFSFDALFAFALVDLPPSGHAVEADLGLATVVAVAASNPDDGAH